MLYFIICLNIVINVNHFCILIHKQGSKGGHYHAVKEKKHCTPLCTWQKTLDGSEINENEVRKLNNSFLLSNSHYPVLIVKLIAYFPLPKYLDLQKSRSKSFKILVWMAFVYKLELEKRRRKCHFSSFQQLGFITINHKRLTHRFKIVFSCT